MRLLVVEDQKKMASFLKRGLTEAGYAVDLAETGQAAESLAEENPYDLIVLDAMLPDQNGFDTARHLRVEAYSGPILMLTALSGTKDKIHGLDAGADDYLVKPFDFEELLARIRALLRRHSGTTAAGNSVLKFADIQMDLIKRKIHRGKRELLLTAKEFSLLEYFLRNPGRPVSRTEISEHVWDAHFDSESNVIDVYINLLRKKLETGQEKKILKTVIGIGYALTDENPDAQ